MPERSTPVPEGEGPDATDTDERMREAKRAIDEFVAGLDARSGAPPRAVPGAGPDEPQALPRPSDEATPGPPAAAGSFDEALDRLAYALDRAASAGRSSLAISHGRGTGTLRKVVHEYLRDHPLVSSFRMGEQGEGGTGVTVVKFVGS